MKYNFIIIYIIFSNLQTLLANNNSIEQIKVKDQKDINISFGSCNKYEEHQKDDLFFKTAELNPDAFVWLGDVAYIDYYWIQYCIFWWIQEQDINIIRRKFNSTKYDDGYQALLKTNTRILGVYDDHDSNQNDGDKNNPMKYMMQKEFLTFLDEPKDSKRWEQSNLYASYYFGEQNKVKLITLDARSDRDDPYANPEDVLGKDQWNRLEQDLADPSPEIFIISSGYLFMPDDKFIIENWYWWSKKKLMNLLSKYKKRVILISGDIHYAELSRYPCDLQTIGQPMYELTSSGISFSEIEFPFVEYLIHIWTTDNFSTEETRYLGKNFGNLNIQINEDNISESTISLEIYGMEGIQTPQIQKILKFSELEFDPSLIDLEKECYIKENQGFYRLILSIFPRLIQGRLAAYVVVIFSIFSLFILIKLVKKIFQLGKKQKKKVKQQ